MKIRHITAIVVACLVVLFVWANTMRWHALGARPETYGVTVRLPCLSIEYSYWIEHRRLAIFYQRRVKMGGLSSNLLWHVDSADWK